MNPAMKQKYTAQRFPSRSSHPSSSVELGKYLRTRNGWPVDCRRPMTGQVDVRRRKKLERDQRGQSDSKRPAAASTAITWGAHESAF